METESRARIKIVRHRLSVMVPEDLYRQVEQICWSRGDTVTLAVREALRMWVESNQTEVEESDDK